MNTLFLKTASIRIKGPLYLPYIMHLFRCTDCPIDEFT